jgi:hypothetical protein
VDQLPPMAPLGSSRPSRRAAARGQPDLTSPYRPSGAEPSPMPSRGSEAGGPPPRRGIGIVDALSIGIGGIFATIGLAGTAAALGQQPM